MWPIPVRACKAAVVLTVELCCGVTASGLKITPAHRSQYGQGGMLLVQVRGTSRAAHPGPVRCGLGLVSPHHPAQFVPITKQQLPKCQEFSMAGESWSQLLYCATNLSTRNFLFRISRT